ncbi:MAG: OmpA family protein, partial [Cyclobacteriaceae bacterium]
DGDGDGLSNALDACPEESGPIDNNGCPEVKDADGNVLINLTEEEESVLKEAFENLEFASSKDILTVSSLIKLEGLAELLIQKINYRLLIQGHTDNLGGAANNLKLSQDRAEAVKRYLVSKGVAAVRITTEGYGEARPIASNVSADGRQKNRRVELKVIK